MKQILSITLLSILILSGCVGSDTARRRDYVEYSPRMEPARADQILRGEVRTGMTREDVLASWGKPTHFIPGYSDPTVTLETWVYRYHLVFGTGYYRLEFRDGILQEMIREYY